MIIEIAPANRCNEIHLCLLFLRHARPPRLFLRPTTDRLFCRRTYDARSVRSRGIYGDSLPGFRFSSRLFSTTYVYDVSR
ncbi:MAG: hypothetical protein OXF02_05995 [Simkaniaceae bacterium]|nr:hypothetical protein [Simkaniaceae bacterium]